MDTTTRTSKVCDICSSRHNDILLVIICLLLLLSSPPLLSIRCGVVHSFPAPNVLTVNTRIRHQRKKGIAVDILRPSTSFPCCHYLSLNSFVGDENDNSINKNDTTTTEDDNDYDSNPDPTTQSTTALDTILPREKLKLLTSPNSKSNVQGTLQVIWHMMLLVIASCCFRCIPTISLVASAFVSSFFFCGLHECIHRTAFKSKQLNDLFGHVFGFLTLRPAKHYFYYHWQHHKYTGNTELDSELAAPGSLLDMPVETVPGYLSYLTGIPFWMDAISSIVRHAFGRSDEIYLPTNTVRREVSREARIYLTLYGGLALLSTRFNDLAKCLWNKWILPGLIGQVFLRFYLLAEHRGRIMNSTLIYENTRTMQTNWFYRRLAYCMPFHMEHHAWPSIPFHKLHIAHKLLADATATTNNNSSAANCSNSNLLDRGEQVDKSAGRNGYIRFHLEFLKHLLQQQSTTG